MIAGAPPREWLAVFFLPVVGAILILQGQSEARSSEDGWLAFGTALLVGVLVAIVPIVALARQGLLFIRDPETKERNRAAVGRLVKRFGWLVPGFLVVAFFVFDGLAVVLPTMLGGFALGYAPGVVVNFLRLRRERR